MLTNIKQVNRNSKGKIEESREILDEKIKTK